MRNGATTSAAVAAPRELAREHTAV